MFACFLSIQNFYYHIRHLVSIFSINILVLIKFVVIFAADLSNMKRGSGQIAALFGKYEAKKFVSSESPSVVVDLQAEDTPKSGQLLQFSDSPPPVDTCIEAENDAQPTTPSSPHLPSKESADSYLPFECDPAKRIPNL